MLKECLELLWKCSIAPHVGAKCVANVYLFDLQISFKASSLKEMKGMIGELAKVSSPFFYWYIYLQLGLSIVLNEITRFDWFEVFSFHTID